MALFCLWEWKGAILPIVPSEHLVRCTIEQFSANALLKCISLGSRPYPVFISACLSSKYAKGYFRATLLSNSRTTSGFVGFSTIYYIPQFFQAVLAYSPVRAGIFLIPYLVVQVVTSRLSVCCAFVILDSHRRITRFL